MAFSPRFHHLSLSSGVLSSTVETLPSGTGSIAGKGWPTFFRKQIEGKGLKHDIYKRRPSYEQIQESETAHLVIQENIEWFDQPSEDLSSVINVLRELSISHITGQQFPKISKKCSTSYCFNTSSPIVTSWIISSCYFDTEKYTSNRRTKMSSHTWKLSFKRFQVCSTSGASSS